MPKCFRKNCPEMDLIIAIIEKVGTGDFIYRDVADIIPHPMVLRQLADAGALVRGPSTLVYSGAARPCLVPVKTYQIPDSIAILASCAGSAR